VVTFGDLLPGFTVNEPLFEEWLVAERERLRELALDALARGLLARQTNTSGTERAIQTAVRLVGLDPLQDAVHRPLLRLYVRQGRRGAAPGSPVAPEALEVGSAHQRVVSCPA
jgi:DNA-binding SARP family transcriptional activator